MYVTKHHANSIIIPSSVTNSSIIDPVCVYGAFFMPFNIFFISSRVPYIRNTGMLCNGLKSNNVAILINCKYIYVLKICIPNSKYTHLVKFSSIHLYYLFKVIDNITFFTT